MRRSGLVVGVVATVLATVALNAGQRRPAPPPSVRLYVFDGGVLESDPARYKMTKEDVGTTQLSVAAYLIAHPKGVLMWDTGAITDADWTPTGKPSVQKLTLPDGQVWEQIREDEIYHPARWRRDAAQMLVTIKPDAMHTYVLTIHDENRMYKVKRIR